MWIVDRWSAAGRSRSLVTLFSVACLALSSQALAAETALAHPVVFCQLPVDRTPSEARAGGMLPADYGGGARLMLFEPGGRPIDLAPDLASACDPDVSFDGERILFAGQRSVGDPWNIFEVRADGTGLRQITHETLDARHPIYLATLYTITSSEPWYTILFVGDDGVLNETASARGTSLYAVRLDGTERRRITFHPGNDRTPFLMPDGLLVFAGWRQSSESADASGRIGLYGIQTDGIDYAEYGGSAGRRIQHMPTVTSNGTVVFIEADSVSWDGAGQLAAIDASRPHHSYRPLSAEGDGLFHSPSPLDELTILASQRSSEGTLRIVRYSLSQGLLDVVHQDPEHHSFHARLVAPRPEPDGRSSTVRPEAPNGKLFALDVYESQTPLSTLPPGSVRRVRAIEGLPLEKAPTESAGVSTAHGQVSRVFRRLLGEAPVEEDGSFHIDIPADLPVQLQLLDDDGMVLASCDWIWVKQREFHGCIGCHEDPELTPPNRFVDAAKRPANELTLPPERRRTVTFREHVVPVLRSVCQGCHWGTESALVLTDLDTVEGSRAVYDALLQTLVTPGSARISPLVWRLLGRDTSRPRDSETGSVEDFPKDHVDLLGEEETTIFIEWIDLGSQWDSDPQN